MSSLIALFALALLPTCSQGWVLGKTTRPRSMRLSAKKEREMVPVRFINTPTGDDVISAVPKDAILLFAGDNCGLHISRGCKTGLCGACTVDLVDPTWDAEAHELAGNKDGRPGFQTVRSCSTNVGLLPGQDELVVDLFRTTEQKNGSAGSEAMEDPMARFGESWEKDFVPDYKSQGIESPIEKKMTPEEKFRIQAKSRNGIPPWEIIYGPDKPKK